MKWNGLLRQKTLRQSKMRIESTRVHALDSLLAGSSVEVTQLLGDLQLENGQMPECESLQSAILSASPDGIVISDLEGRVRVVSPQVLNMLGLACEEEVNGRMIFAFIYAEDREKARENIGLMFQGIYTGPGEYRAQRADGSLFHIEANAEFIKDSTDSPQGLVLIIRDITERKRAEETLRSSEERYHALMDQSFEALLLVDIQTRQVVEVNRKFTELLGYSLPEDAPLYVQQFILDSRSSLDRIFDETLRTQRILPAEARIFIHKKGFHVPVERAATVIIIGGRTYVLNSLRDMTEERRRQADIEKDINVATRVQQELLPVLPESPSVAIRTLYKPSNFVSGDSYYLGWRKKGKLLRGFLIDVSGHGLATALQTASVNALVREIAVLKLSLLEQMKQINERVTQYFADESYAALLGFELDLSARELRCVAAGITQFYVNGKRIVVPGMFVGLWKNAKFEETKIALSKGDTFYFFTDGFTDFLEEPENASFLSPDGKAFENDFAALRQLMESGTLRDDATGICLKLSGFKGNKK